MVINTSTIYIKLLDENVFVLRPTKGRLVQEMIFEVLPTDNYDPEDEHWEFPPGTIVRCSREYSANLGREIIVANKEVDPKNS